MEKAHKTVDVKSLIKMRENAFCQLKALPQAQQLRVIEFIDQLDDERLAALDAARDANLPPDESQ